MCGDQGGEIPNPLPAERRFAPRLSRYFRETGGVRVFRPKIEPVEKKAEPYVRELKILKLRQALQGFKYLGPLNADFPSLERIGEIVDPNGILICDFHLLRYIEIAESEEECEAYEQETGKRVKTWLEKGRRTHGYAEARIFPEFSQVRIFVPINSVSLAQWQP